MKSEGIYYDGKSSDRQVVSVTRTGMQLHITGAGIALSYDLRQVKATAPLGRTHRTLQLPDGGVCELAAQVRTEDLLPRQGGLLGGWLHRWERSLPTVVAALLLIVLLVWAFGQFGIPHLARRVAFAIPPALEKSLGEETLVVLDRAFLAPSGLSTERQEEVRALFGRMRQEFPEAAGYRLELRLSGALGANALALPAGIIVMTDGLVELSMHDEEIIGVLAHELAHVQRRHALRHVLQNSITGLVLASLTGDFTSITSLAAALPTALVDARYSRAFELEADDAAVAYLQQRGIATHRYADMLERLQVEQERRSGDQKGQPFGRLFSTHPETRKRVERVLGGR
jgi:Zn-dependent protease with chaperone function